VFDLTTFVSTGVLLSSFQFRYCCNGPFS